MRVLLLAVLLAVTAPPPSVSIALDPRGAEITVWMLNSDSRYEDFVFHIAGKPDVPIHVPTGALQTVSMPFCGQFDMTAETVSSPPVFIAHYATAVRCRTFYVPFP